MSGDDSARVSGKGIEDMWCVEYSIGERTPQGLTMSRRRTKYFANEEQALRFEDAVKRAYGKIWRPTHCPPADSESEGCER